ncbi:MAG: hypothetical protein IT431_06795 [Phycisphaerales bacterium]|nr:hypothetical protein [Phycisphaerales bacterium]
MAKSVAEVTKRTGEALTVAAAVAAVFPEAAAVAALGGLVGNAAIVGGEYLERKRARMAERIQAIREEVVDRRLSRIEEELEVGEEQIDLAVHVFHKALEDDESAKERYYGALLELVLRNQIDVQTLKVLVSAVASLARIELDEFVYSSRPSRSTWHFNENKVRDAEAPRKRPYDYPPLLVNRLVGVCLVRAELKNPDPNRSVNRKTDVPQLRNHVTQYGETLLAAVTGERPDPDSPRSPLTIL